MSGVRRLSGAFVVALRSLASLLGWLSVWPLVMLLPRKKNRVAVIGRQSGFFLDNAKYFFLQAVQDFPDVRFVFLSENRDVVDAIRARGGEALLYPLPRALWFLLRCSCAVVDDVAWYRKGRRQLLAGAGLIQLWHGVGCKRIERERWAHEQVTRIDWLQRLSVSVRLAAYRISGRWPTYSLVTTTSQFYLEQVFRPAFRARSFMVTGYPRNDFGRSLDQWRLTLAWDNVDAGISSKLVGWREAGRRLILVVPTFRDSGAPPLRLDPAALSRLDEYATAEGLEFIFKFHPMDSSAVRISGQHLHVCAANSDVYPLFPHVAALVTDYSSIASDYFLVDRPVLYLVPDGPVPSGIQFQFAPTEMMAGAITHDWDGLLAAMKEELQVDSHRAARAVLRLRMFDNLPQAGAVSNIVSTMQQAGWLR